MKSPLLKDVDLNKHANSYINILGIIMQKNYLLISLLLIYIVSSSCTVLQWRKSDKEIQENFKVLNISSVISYFRVDSLDLNVRIQEISTDGKDVNLLFVHGAPSSISTWEKYLIDTTLIAATNMYALDRPGYGYSNFGDEITSIDQQSQILSAIINENKLQNVIAIGSSYGGPIAARVGLLNPNVKAVVMISPAIDPSIEKDFWASRFTQWKLTRWLVPTAYRVAGDEKQFHARELALIENDWKNLTIPILHFHGNIDDIVPYENINFSKENFQNVEVISISDKGHEISYKNSELIIPHIIDLINQIQEDD
ncbi:alpha/beta fold hydrolase [Ulvibacter antarcticus]|uniref:alpha/beta fold hydrolase n=1 Tax=Ulvibacter antarcticus TaxID=442714 RepID=UPI001FECC632|nr:alpha/beta hydrolase [Ulvibacter antarcticus]